MLVIDRQGMHSDFFLRENNNTFIVLNQVIEQQIHKHDNWILPPTMLKLVCTSPGSFKDTLRSNNSTQFLKLSTT